MIKPKRRLQPLSNNDVMLAILRHEQDPDRTEEYRLWLRHLSSYRQNGQHILLMGDRQRPEQLPKPKINIEELHLPEEMLTEGSILQVTQRQIKSMLRPGDLSAQNALFNERIAAYEGMLSRVLNLHAVSQQNYQREVVMGQRELQGLNQHVQSVIGLVTHSRQECKLLKEDIGIRSMSIMVKMQRMTSIKQVLDIIGVWRGTLLDNMKYFNQQRALQFGVGRVLTVMKETRKRFKTERKRYLNYDCFERIGQFLDTKQSQVVSFVSELMDAAIIDFNAAVYGRILQNYMEMANHVELHSKLQNLPLLLQNNLNTIFKRSMVEIGGLDKLQAVSGSEYLRFFERLLPLLEGYLHNWHLATRWHLEFTSPEQPQFEKQIKAIGDDLLKFRKTVWSKAEQKVADLIAKSFKFYTLTLNQRSLLMLKLFDFIRAGNFFCSASAPMLPKILKQKLRDENELFLKHVSNLIKFSLNKELRVPIFEQLISSMNIDQSYVCELTPEELLHLDQLVNGEVPKDYDPLALKPASSQEEKELALDYDKAFQFEKNTACYFLHRGVLEMGRRAYLQPRMNYEIFLKARELVEMLLFYIYRFAAGDVQKKQLHEQFLAITDIRLQDEKDFLNQLPLMEHYMECATRQKRYPLLKKEMGRIASRWESTRFAGMRRPESSIASLIFLLENTCAVVNWLKNNLPRILKGATTHEKARMQQDLDELFPMTLQLVNFTYDGYYEDLKLKYNSLHAGAIDLKWDLRKYNSQNAGIYRDYKNKLIEQFTSQANALRELKFPQQIKTKIETGMVDVFFQVMLDIYQKIDKVNENGRQLMRLDVIELSKQIESLGIPTHSSIQKGYLDSYLSYWFFRDPKDLEKNIASAQENYPIRVWKNLISTSMCSGQMSSKQKRDMLLRAAQRHLELIGKKRSLKSE